MTGPPWPTWSGNEARLLTNYPRFCPHGLGLPSCSLPDDTRIQTGGLDVLLLQIGRPQERERRRAKTHLAALHIARAYRARVRSIRYIHQAKYQVPRN